MNEEKHYDVEAVKQRLIDLRDLRREIENQSVRAWAPTPTSFVSNRSSLSD